MNPETVATAFITQLTTAGVVAHFYDYPADEPQVPAIQAYPESLYDITFGLSQAARFVVVGLTPTTATRDGYSQACAFLASSGTQSIEAAIYADNTLAGAVTSTELVTKTFTFVALGETNRRYFGARHVFEVLS